MSHCRKRNASSEVERQIVNGVHVEPPVDQGDKAPRAAKRRRNTQTVPAASVTTDTEKKGNGVFQKIPCPF